MRDDLLNCEYCNEPIYPLQRWTEVTGKDGFSVVAHSACCWNQGFEGGNINIKMGGMKE